MIILCVQITVKYKFRREYDKYLCISCIFAAEKKSFFTLREEDFPAPLPILEIRAKKSNHLRREIQLKIQIQ